MRTEWKQREGETSHLVQWVLSPLFSVEKGAKDIQVFIEDEFAIQQEYLHLADI